MAETMTSRFLPALMVALALAGPLGSRAAEALPDPTRPAAMPGEPGAPEGSSSPIQSILKTPGGYRAMINGELLKPGDMLDQDRILRITENEVVVRKPDGRRETLNMYPEVDWRRRDGRRDSPAKASPPARKTQP